MKRRLTEIVRCPVCMARLALHVVREEMDAAADSDGPGVDEGFLACTGCRLLYPIIAGVPRLIRNAYDEHTPFFHVHRTFIRELAGQEDLLEPGTAG